MSAAAIETLKAEIARRESEIAIFEQALAALGQAPEPAHPKKMLALQAPKAKPGPRQERGETQVFTINGIDINIRGARARVLEALIDAEDCVADKVLAKLAGSMAAVYPMMSQLNARLKPAGSEIVRFPEGYRLQVIEASA